MRGDGTRLREDLTALDFFLLGAAEEAADVVAGLALIEALAEHFNAGDDGLGGLMDTDDFDGIVDLDNAAFDTAGDDGAAAFNAEHVFDRHEEGLIDVADGIRNPGIDGVHELLDALAGGIIGAGGLQGRESGALHDRGVVAVETVLGEELADFHFDEFDEFGIGEVHLVEENDDAGHADLLGEEDVFLGLGHDAVGAVDHEDRAVHLGSAGDHVLDVVGVTGAVDVSVVALVALIFNVGGGDRQNLGSVAAALGLGSLGNLVVGDVVCETLHVLDMRDRSGKSGFAVVDVTDGTDVDVRFGSCERFLCHFLILLGVVRLASRMFSVLLCVKGYSCMIQRESGAYARNRTGDLILTKDALYQLSYVGNTAYTQKRSGPPCFRSVMKR